MKKVTSLLCLFFSISVYSQTPVSSYTIVNTPASQLTNTANGYGPEYSSSNIYNTHFGQSGSGSGVERVINGFKAGSASFKKILTADGKPFNEVNIKHILGQPETVLNAFYETVMINGNDLYFSPGYSDDLSNLLNSFSCNRGVENIFTNSGSTSSNIERIDFVMNDGIVCDNLTGQGFLINERNGNDDFKIAAITGFDMYGDIIIGDLKNISASGFGKVGPSISSTVLSRDMLMSDPHFRPKQNVSTQTVAGVFVSFADLGLTAGTTIYGFALYPNDVDETQDLTGLKTVPPFTEETDGGLDLLAGTGYYVQTQILPVTNLQLKGSKVAKDVKLNWSVDYEVDNYVFEVQRSNDLNNWKTIGTVAAGTQQTSNKYAFTDISPVSGNNFYRLKQIDIDRNFSFSKTIAVKDDGTKELKSFFPNPAKSKAFLYVNDLNQQAEKVKVTNIAGFVVAEFLIKNLIQNNVLTIDVTSFANGIYQVQVFNKDKTAAAYKLAVRH